MNLVVSVASDEIVLVARTFGCGLGFSDALCAARGRLDARTARSRCQYHDARWRFATRTIMDGGGKIEVTADQRATITHPAECASATRIRSLTQGAKRAAANTIDAYPWGTRCVSQVRPGGRIRAAFQHVPVTARRSPRAVRLCSYITAEVT
jgi:hypothetical protein